MPYISFEDLVMIKRLIIDKDMESCGFLFENKENDELSIFLESYGSEIKKPDGKVLRGLCTWSKYTKYMWHTHSSNLIAYPSPEDLLYVIKDRGFEDPLVSIVFTKWGIWEMSNYGKKYKLTSEWIEYIKKKIDKIFKNLYLTTEKGRGELIDEIQISYVQSIVDAVNYEINNLRFMKEQTFQLSFTPWQNIEKNTSYFLK